MVVVDLRAAIQQLLEGGTFSPEDEAEKKICTNVTEQILKHSNAHVEIFLALYDAGDINKLREHKHVHYFVSDIVRLRYSSGNLTQLMDLLWGINSRKIEKQLKFGCDSSLYFVKQIEQHPDHKKFLPQWRKWQKICLKMIKLCRYSNKGRCGLYGYPHDQY
jgi:hypothetical protein